MQNDCKFFQPKHFQLCGVELFLHGDFIHLLKEMSDYETWRDRLPRRSFAHRIRSQFPAYSQEMSTCTAPTGRVGLDVRTVWSGMFPLEDYKVSGEDYVLHHCSLKCVRVDRAILFSSALIQTGVQFRC